MKVTKLFYLMAMAACFAACTEEVLVQPEKTIDSFDDVKGAKVVAEGFSIDLKSETPQTKVTAENGEGKWVGGDVAGIAWYVNGVENVASSQENVKIGELSATAMANHKLEYNEETSRFESNSNVFAGWHVAYHPYAVMKKPGAIEKIKVNDQMSKPIGGEDYLNDYAEDQFNYMPKFSIAHHVSEDNVTDEGLIKANIDLTFIANALRPQFTVADNFKNDEELGALEIVSVELSADEHKLFANTLAVNPSKFPTGEETFSGKNFGLKGASITGSNTAFVTNEYETSVITDLTKVQENYALNAGKLYTRMYVAPVNAEVAKDVTLNDLSIVVTLSDGSTFTITAGDDEDSKNYIALDKLWKLINSNYSGYKLTEFLIDNEGKHKPVDLDLELNPADYTRAYEVSSIETWEDAIATAIAAGTPEVTFNIAKDKVISFAPDSEGGMKVPEDLKIVCITGTTKSTFEFTGATTWSSNVTVDKYTSIKIAEDGKLTLNSSIKPYSVDVETGATLAVGNITLEPAKNINNAGTIEVSLGSKLNKLETKGGKVVYYAQETDSADAISTMIKNANVTDIVVNNDWTVGGVNNNTVAVEFNGAVVEFESDATFKSVNVASGVNTITGNITAPVTVAAGATLTIDGNVTGEVTVEDGGTLTINGNVTGDVTVEAPAAVGDAVDAENPVDFTINGNVSGKVTVGGKAILNGNKIGNLIIDAGAEVTVTSDDFMTIGAIENKGTLNVVGINVYADSITTEAGSKTNIPDDKAIYYKESYKNNGGTTTGSVAVINVDEENDNYYKGDGYELIEGVYYVNSNDGLASALSANKDIIVELSADVKFTTATNLGGESTTSIVINGNGHVITFVQSETTASDAIETVNTTNPEAVLTINNATITEESTIGKFWYNDDLIFGCKVVLTDVKATRMIAVENNATFTNFTSDCTNVEGSYYSIWIRPMTDNQVVTFNTTDNKKNLINNPDGRGIKIEKEYVAEPKHVTLNVNNTTFITGVKAAILVNTPAGATINWGEGNDISKTFDPEYPVWVDEAASTDDFLLVNGQNCTPVTESSRQKALEEQE